LRDVLDASAGKALIPEDGGTGLLRTAAEESGHPRFVLLAIQLGFVSRGLRGSNDSFAQLKLNFARLKISFTPPKPSGRSPARAVGVADVAPLQLRDGGGVQVQTQLKSLA
jgi:hypothetical protein